MKIIEKKRKEKKGTGELDKKVFVVVHVDVCWRLFKKKKDCLKLISLMERIKRKNLNLSPTLISHK